MNTIRVLVVDDSVLIRYMLKEIIDRQSGMQVVGMAPDADAARDMIKSLRPDVLTLDVDMPRMDGLQFLEELMRARPMPVVMVSGLTDQGTEATLRALELGAVDFISKARLEISRGVEILGAELGDKIRGAAIAKVRRLDRAAQARAAPVVPLPPLLRLGTEKLIFVGSSTGGTEALRVLLSHLPANAPAVLVTQHMPPGFTRSFAERLNNACRITVEEARHEGRVLPGHAYIAPGDRHLKVGRSGTSYVTLLEEGPPVNRHRPSVEVLFKSAARFAGPNALGVMLTGMGKDGALAMLEMRRAGAYNVAQDEASCVVFGMPKEAIAAGATHEVLPLGEIAPSLMRQLAMAGAGDVRV